MASKPKTATTTVSSLGTIQIHLESATRELKLAQDVYTKAVSRLKDAEMNHEKLTLELVNEMKTIREANTVSPVSLR